MAHPVNRATGTREVIRPTAHLGQCARQAPGCLSSSDLGRAQNAGPAKSMPFVENLNLSSLDLGSAHNIGPALESSPQSNLESEQCRQGKHSHHELGQPSVVHTL